MNKTITSHSRQVTEDIRSLLQERGFTDDEELESGLEVLLVHLRHFALNKGLNIDYLFEKSEEGLQMDLNDFR